MRPAQHSYGSHDGDDQNVLHARSPSRRVSSFQAQILWLFAPTREAAMVAFAKSWRRE
jgi:hypothetical protein